MSAPSTQRWADESLAEALSPIHYEMLEVLMDRLMPGDEAHGIPSASAVGAARFVSRLLARDPPVYYEVPAWRELYPQALDALDAAANASWGVRLAELPPESLDELLEKLLAGQLMGMPAGLDQPLIFKTLLRHCYQGCFGDPRWGGNRNAEMWRRIGYPLRTAES